MKFFICKTTFLLVLMIGSIQMSAKNIYISTAGTATVDGSTPANPAPFSLLRDYLSSYRVDNITDKQLNVYFLDGTYTLTTENLTFSSTASRVKGLEVNFLPLTPSNGGAKGVVFDRTGVTNTRFIRMMGNASNPMSMSIKDVRIQNFKSADWNASGASSLFSLNEGSSLTLDDVIVDQIESHWMPFVHQRVSESSFVVKNSVLSNITTASTSSGYAILECNSSTGTTSLENCLLEAWKTNSNGIISASNLTMKDCTVKDCTTTGSSGYMIRINVSGTNTEIAGNSFVNNNTPGASMLYFSNGASVVYNNTFSGNNASSADQANTVAIELGTAGARAINNTLYNSGGITVTNSSARAINNIVAGAGKIAGSQANATTCWRNISGNSYYPAGLTGGVNIGTLFNAQFNTALSGTGNGRMVHDLVASRVNDADHVILGKGGRPADLSAVLSNTSILASDQRGKERPEIISLGAVDLRHYLLSNANVVILYDSNTASLPAPRTINLQDYILGYPDGITASNTSFVLSSGTTLPNGTLSALQGTTVTFTPRITAGEYTGGALPAVFYYTVSATGSDGITYSRTGKVTVTVVDTNNPPGHIRPGDFPLTCYDYMGTVAFTSSFRFVTSYTESTDHVNGKPKAESPPINEPADDFRLYGFTIPLVGDLDEDGYPEIIGVGTTTATDYPHYNFLHIYNGQTGELLAKLPFDLASGTTYSGANNWHASPSIVALVDSDRDGKIEVIAAFPHTYPSTTSFPYADKVVSYVLTPVKTGGVTTGYTMALNPKWATQPSGSVFISVVSKFSKKGSAGVTTIPCPVTVAAAADNIANITNTEFLFVFI